MTARCHEDSCSIVWSEVTTLSGPAFHADVQLNETSIVCDAEDGLEVLISPAAGNILSNAGAGIYASLPASIIDSLAANPDLQGVAPSADADAPQTSATYTWDNDLGRDALAIITGTFNLRYAVLGEDAVYSYAADLGTRQAVIGNLTPYNAQAAFRVDLGIDAAPTNDSGSVGARPDIGGLLVSPGTGADVQYRTSRVPFATQIRVGAGEQLRVNGKAWWDGPDQTVNLVAANLGGATGVGFELWNTRVGAIPL